MSEASRQLRRELSGGIRENPLLTLGIAAQVLELELPEDELYEYIMRDVARRLLMRLHSDQIKDPVRLNRFRVLQGRLSQAYEELKSREKFQQALSDFRNMKSEERSETRQLREALHRARQSLELYQVRQVGHERAVSELDRGRLVLEQAKAHHALVAPNLKVHNQSLTRSLMAAKVRSRARLRRLRHVLNYVYELCDYDTARGPHAFEAKWVIVAIQTPKIMVELPLPLASARGYWKPDFLETIKHLGIPDEALHGARREWSKVVRSHRLAGGQDANRVSQLRIVVMALECGKPKVVYGWEKPNVVGGRVIGSFVPYKGLKMEPKRLTHMLRRSDMFKGLIPFLTPGSLLVSEKTRKIIHDQNDRPIPSVFRETRQVILAVG